MTRIRFSLPEADGLTISVDKEVDAIYFQVDDLIVSVAYGMLTVRSSGPINQASDLLRVPLSAQVAP